MRRDDDPAPGDAADDRAGPADPRSAEAEGEPGDGASPPPGELAGILKMLAASPDARGELVEDVRRQLADGDYLTEDRLNLAIYRLLKDLLA